MFAKQFSEAGATSGAGGGKKGGRGGKGGGLMSKSKRRGKDLEDAGDSNTGLFNMDPNTPYRTHMLFPGRKEDDCGGPDPRRSSGSPGFVKAMMGWGSKRPSQTGGGAPNSQEMARYNRGTPTRPPEGMQEMLEPMLVDPLYRKSVSFHEVSPTRVPLYPHFHPTSTNTHSVYPYHHNEPYRENDYAAFAVGNMLFLPPLTAGQILTSSLSISLGNTTNSGLVFLWCKQILAERCQNCLAPPSAPQSPILPHPNVCYN